MNQPKLPLENLDALERQTFDYFVYEVNPLNGLVVDKTQVGAPASIAAVGLALSAYPVGVERGFITRAEAVERTLATLRFFRNSSQDKGIEATGYQGFYYHFLDMKTGRRVWRCELSTVDTAFLAGMLTAAAYFTNEAADEREIRTLDVLSRCSTKQAPWFVIPSDHKWFRNLAIARIVVDHLEALDMNFPPPSVDLEHIRREYHSAKEA